MSTMGRQQAPSFAYQMRAFSKCLAPPSLASVAMTARMADICSSVSASCTVPDWGSTSTRLQQGVCLG